MITTKNVSELIHQALAPIVPTFPVVVDALEGNEEIGECAWYRLTPTELMTKDKHSNNADLQVAIVCDSYDRALILSEEAMSALRLTMERSNVGVQAFTTSFEYSQEDVKHIAYLSTYLVY